jgi:hypothetical protein
MRSSVDVFYFCSFSKIKLVHSTLEHAKLTGPCLFFDIDRSIFVSIEKKSSISPIGQLYKKFLWLQRVFNLLNVVLTLHVLAFCCLKLITRKGISCCNNVRASANVHRKLLTNTLQLVTHLKVFMLSNCVHFSAFL